jgi:hypothetical protein
MTSTLDTAVTLSPQGLRVLKLSWATTLFAAKLQGPEPYASLNDAQQEVEILLSVLLDTEGCVEPMGNGTPAGTLQH